MKVIGIDLGGTNYAVGLVDETGNILSRIEGKTKVDEGPQAVAKRLSESVKSVMSNTGVSARAIGIGSPGSIDHEKGVVRFSPNFPGWYNFPLAEEIRTHTGLDVFIENDANAYALGEHTFGVARGFDHVICLTLGTGIGGGVITHGFLLRGSVGIGAELGHMNVLPNGPKCGCGSNGCLESLASATAIRKYVEDGYSRHIDSSLFKEKNASQITPKDVFEHAKNGDYFSLSVFNRVVSALSVAIGSLINIFNPQVVVIGGGMANAGDFLLEPVEEMVKDYVLPTMLGTYQIKLSQLGKNAGILGAASIVFERASKR
ncbi:MULTISPECIES: ROK family protein [Pseudothermotoga]|uniref:Glucokinase n=1 Tax=Pseudothermotoga lettingae (strain ATCC BAA-301 / DSM 14385 / NBRC 107922 / TMO) TaxID=416591 RepID=A8F4U2_PSELT|nr:MULTISPECIES: ROK family protein [Pseudothermotoga]ABV33176.1 putative glucokinase, ROK family [Pseudothermotoga lettingae TMO]KUK20290.1 MAG: Putative glucokinase, ROK family [Pseudothermotoga lettingae]MDI3494442.1 glucokinase [Pseudothermotoga sp.]MDK2884181.1 glucokinase [Pseudothermotoga sp.]GLI49907.1 glucokinase [Pseudothermotoga lettingae TMO]